MAAARVLCCALVLALALAAAEAAKTVFPSARFRSLRNPEPGFIGYNVGVCGPDITDALKQTVRNARASVAAYSGSTCTSPWSTKEWRCCASTTAKIKWLNWQSDKDYQRPPNENTAAFQNAWDTPQLKPDFGLPINVPVRNFGTSHGCSSGGPPIPDRKRVLICRETVTVDGKCHFIHSVNYVLWGLIGKWCNLDHYLLFVRAFKNWIVSSSSFFKDDAIAWATAGFNGWPDSGSTPESTMSDPSVKLWCKAECAAKYDKTFDMYWYPGFVAREGPLSPAAVTAPCEPAYPAPPTASQQSSFDALKRSVNPPSGCATQPASLGNIWHLLTNRGVAR